MWYTETEKEVLDLTKPICATYSSVTYILLPSNVDGEVLRNKEVFEMFNLPHLKTKSKLERCKNLRTTLEYYGVDTSEISIHLCDGDVIQWNQPV